MSWNSCLPKWASTTFLVLLAASIAAAQQPSSDRVAKILDRLDELEKQNQELLSEIKALREELQNSTAAAQKVQNVEEKVDVAEQRIEEQAQTKVQASQRFPISLTGMFLFDAFAARGMDTSRFLDAYGDDILGAPGGGATLRQSIIGLEFHGPQIFGNGRVNGFLSMDFYAEGASDDDVLRIRRGIVSFDWKNRSIIFGQDKSIIAPLQPTSFARVGIPPLAGSGNLWLWRPQVTYQERIPFTNTFRATLEASMLETDESYTAPSLAGNSYETSNRPAIQARAQIEYRRGDESKIAIGVSGSGSTSHVLGQPVPSRVASADLFTRPWRWLEISGTILRGKNFAGLGGLPQGVTIESNQSAVAIHGTAGWLQAAFPVTKRLTLDIYSGRQLNDARDLTAFEVKSSETSAANILYRLGPNVVLGFEAARNRVAYLNNLRFWTDRYDATVAYLF